MTTPPEAWLRGPIEGIEPVLMPAAHALVEARDNLTDLLPALESVDLWERAGSAAPLGFHLRHLAGALDRLFTYAGGRALDAAQKAALAKERLDRDDAADAASLVSDALATIDRALDQLRATSDLALFEPRPVGRAAVPSNVLGLLFHGAEHTSRHVGQIITTLKVLGASGHDRQRA